MFASRPEISHVHFLVFRLAHTSFPEAWNPTLSTLHMSTQIVGEIRLEHTSLINHWWNVTL